MSWSRWARLLALALTAVAAVLALISFDACEDDAGGLSCAVALLRNRPAGRTMAAGSGRRLASALDGEAATRRGQIRWTSHPSKCLDVRDGLAENGNRLQLWDCFDTSPDQQFIWSSSDGKLRWAAHPEFCIDIFDHKNSNGNFVQLWRCGAANPDQSFDISMSGEGRIRWSTHPEKCIDVQDHLDTNGNTIQIWTCQERNMDQLFTFGDADLGPGSTETTTRGPVSSETTRHGSAAVAIHGHIRWSNFPSKCLDVRDGLAENGNRLQLWDCEDASESQLFQWSSTDRTLRWAAHPDYCVDVHDKKNVNGNHLQLWKCGSSSGAGREFDVAPDGQGKIRWSLHSDKCIDVKDHSAANGNTIQIWACQADNTDQLFTFGDSGVMPTTLPPDEGEAYDIIVVGGGLVGSVVATRLAEDLPGRRVLLVEAGRASQAAVGGTEPPASWDGAGKRWVEWPGLSTLGLTKYDVPGNYERLQCWRQDCQESWGREVPAFQCKVLGGCGVMNGALMQIPHAAMFDSWPASWRHDDLAKHLESAQALFEITPKPSRDGKHYLDRTGEDFVALALSRGGFSSGSTLRPEPKTMGLPQVTAKGGVRQSTASEMLPRAMRLGNFELMLETEVIRISNSGGTADGVTVRRRGRAPTTVRLKAGGRVVLSAGALNTPRLLLSSGITGGGAVGRGVSDHTLVSLIYKVSSSAGAEALAGVSQAYGLPPDSASTSQYASSRSGPLAQFGPTLLAFVRHPDSTGPPEVIDVEAWVNPITQPGEAHVSLVLMRPKCPKATLYLDGGRLRQRGGTNLACSRDREVMDFAIKELDRLLGKAGAQRLTQSPSPRAMNHWVGSCALGSCASPANLVVRGTSNIAVADASLIPEQVWGHPALTLTALGYKAAEILTATVAT